MTDDIQTCKTCEHWDPYRTFTELGRCGIDRDEDATRADWTCDKWEKREGE